jgi:hypothetical protein
VGDGRLLGGRVCGSSRSSSFLGIAFLFCMIVCHCTKQNTLGDMMGILNIKHHSSTDQTTMQEMYSPPVSL